MTDEKREAMLEIAYGIIYEVFSDVCRTTRRGEMDEELEEFLEIQRKLIRLSQKLKKEETGNEE